MASRSLCGRGWRASCSSETLLMPPARLILPRNNQAHRFMSPVMPCLAFALAVPCIDCLHAPVHLLVESCLVVLCHAHYTSSLRHPGGLPSLQPACLRILCPPCQQEYISEPKLLPPVNDSLAQTLPQASHLSAALCINTAAHWCISKRANTVPRQTAVLCTLAVARSGLSLMLALRDTMASTGPSWPGQVAPVMHDVLTGPCRQVLGSRASCRSRSPSWAWGHLHFCRYVFRQRLSA